MRTMTWLVVVGLVAGTAGGAIAKARHVHKSQVTHNRARVDTIATQEFKAAHARMMRNMAMPYTGDPDVDFRMHMIPHHQAAVDMARVALRHAREPWTRQVAEAINIAQPREIYEFQAWLDRRGPMARSHARVDTPATRAFKAAMRRKMAMRLTGDPDVDFRMQMIPHHQAAIDMARVALRHSRDPWTRQDAEAIIIAQQQEIYQFQTWLGRRGAMVPRGGQPRYIIGANSYPEKAQEEPGSQGELIGQTWAPASGVPPQTQISRP